MERKGFGPRLGAFLIDVVILVVIGTVIRLVLGLGFAVGLPGMPGGAAPTAANVSAFRTYLILSSVIGLAYSLMEIFMAATPGKMALKMKITRTDGAPADQATLAQRWAIRHSPDIINTIAALVAIEFVGYIGMAAGLVILVSCFMTLRVTRLALHDEWTGTAVYGPATGRVPAGFDVLPPNSAPPPPGV